MGKRTYNRAEEQYNLLFGAEYACKKDSSDAQYDEEYISELREDISMWQDLIADDIESGNYELAKLDKARLQEAKILLREAKKAVRQALMMQQQQKLAKETTVA